MTVPKIPSFIKIFCAFAVSSTVSYLYINDKIPFVSTYYRAHNYDIAFAGCFIVLFSPLLACLFATAKANKTLIMLITSFIAAFGGYLLSLASTFGYFRRIGPFPTIFDH